MSRYEWICLTNGCAFCPVLVTACFYSAEFTVEEVREEEERASAPKITGLFKEIQIKAPSFHSLTKYFFLLSLFLIFFHCK